MKHLREMTQPGDPMMRIRLPKPLEKALKEAAKRNKRRHQDETIKRITAMMRAGEIFHQVQAQLLPELNKIYQP